MAVPLFDVCPLPACTNLVDDPRVPCDECLRTCGDYLRRVDPPAMTLDDARRELADQHVAQQLARTERAAAQNRGDEWKPGQHCWVCEQRRTCRLDPDQRGQWICKECEAVQ
jgi:hypothetical protein